jgi:hypothetical protein
MTPDEMVRQIERDRRERESGVALFLLALAGRAKNYVNKALRVGTVWSTLVRSVFLGNDALDLPGGVPFLSRAMADTHIAGVRRVGRLVGVTLDIPSLDQLAEHYQPAVTSTLNRITGTLENAVADALSEAAQQDRIHADVRAVGEAFTRAGWTEESSRNAEAESTALVTATYAAGMQEGYEAPQVAAVLTGLRFINPMDARTTDICFARHGVTLPLDHPWLFRSWPPLHFGCRSVVLPLTGAGVKFTENPPELPPPDPGWGQWAGILSARA